VTGKDREKWSFCLTNCVSIADTKGMKTFFRTFVVVAICITFAGAAFFVNPPSAARVMASYWIDHAATDWYDGGDGTDGDPWIISSPELLARMAQQTAIVGVAGNAIRAGHFLITEDIDLTGHNWEPMSQAAALTAVFRGSLRALPNATIYNMAIVSDLDQVGFFVSIGAGAIIDGLTFKNASLENTRTGTTPAGSLGVLAGQILPSNHASNVTAISNITVEDAYLTNMTAAGNIRTGGLVGAIAGEVHVEFNDINLSGIVVDSLSTVGGVLGSSAGHRSDTTIIDTTVEITADITATAFGGFVGVFGPTNAPSNNFEAGILTVKDSTVEIDLTWQNTGPTTHSVGGVIGVVSSSALHADIPPAHQEITVINPTTVDIDNITIKGDMEFLTGGAMPNRGRIVGGINGIYSDITIGDVWVDELETSLYPEWTPRAATNPSGLTTSFLGGLPTNAAQIAASQNEIRIQQSASIAFNTGAGGEVMTSLPARYRLTPGQFTFQIPNITPELNNGNSKFLGWATTSGGTVAHQPNDTINVNRGAHTLFAITDQVMHTVTFVSQGTTYTTRQIGQGSDLTEWIVPSTAPTGHTFSHWYNTAEGILFTDGDSLTINQPLTLTAHFTLNQYIITFEELGGSLVAPIAQNFGTTQTLTTSHVSSLTHYDFLGWATSNGGAVVYEIGDDITFTGDRTLWAVRTPTEYEILFTHVHGAINPNPETFIYTDVDFYLQPLTGRTGWTFQGWYADWEFETPIAEITVVAHTVIWARWTADEFTITYHNVHGATNPNPITVFTVEYLDLVLGNLDGRHGWVFQGWYSDESLTIPITEITTLGNVELWARWQAVITVNGTQTNLTEGLATIADLPDPDDREGWIFLGWSLNAGLNAPVVLLDPDTILTAGMDLVAQWEVEGSGGGMELWLIILLISIVAIVAFVGITLIFLGRKKA